MTADNPSVPHGRDIFARGEQSYTHLGHMILQPVEDLANHLERDHAIGGLPSGNGAWCRWVEMHARAHAVRMEPNDA